MKRFSFSSGEKLPQYEAKQKRLPLHRSITTDSGIDIPSPITRFVCKLLGNHYILTLVVFLSIFTFFISFLLSVFLLFYVYIYMRVGVCRCFCDLYLYITIIIYA
jgi:hypothetical protein